MPGIISGRGFQNMDGRKNYGVVSSVHLPDLKTLKKINNKS